MPAPIYLDCAATTPMAAEAVDAMLPCLTADGLFANASALHHPGQAAAAAIEAARAQLAGALRGKPQDFIFTSGATEANNLAIKGVALGGQQRGRHIITAATEHKSVLDCCRHLETQGFQVTYLRPDGGGLLEPGHVRAAVRADTALVSIMHANNETGVIQNVAGIAQALQGTGVKFHVDASQSAGKLPLDLSATPIDLLSLSAHKFYGPKGIGCLYVRNRKTAALAPLLHGGGQEQGLRPGTLPTAQIVGMAAALALAVQDRAHHERHCRQLRQALLAGLLPCGGVGLNGNQDHCLPNIINLGFAGVSADTLLIALRDHVALSSGSACNSGAMEASAVLRAMGIEGERLYAAVRISFGGHTSSADILEAAGHITAAVTRLRQLAAE